MSHTLHAWLKHLLPMTPSVSLKERVRSGLGAGLGIFLTSVICLWVTQQVGHNNLWLIAPIGASAVLVFAVPASPLAQPWSVIGGNTISALTAIGVLCLMPPSPIAAGLAVGLAVLLMFTTRCIHPPGGATALLVVLTQMHAIEFAFLPVALNSLILVIVGMLFNSMTGKSYPHQPVHEPLNEVTLKRDLEKVLKQHNEYVDISTEDLQIILEDVVALHDEHKNSNT